MTKEKFISLIGPRSVGKSSVGRELAKLLKYRYIDFDKVMNKKLKKYQGIGGFTKKEGWKEYMKKHHKEFKSLVIKLKDKKIILDCGGGAIASEFSQSKLNSSTLKKYSKIILILPNKSKKKSILILFKREKYRKHFAKWTNQELFEKTKIDYKLRVPVMEKLANNIIYMGKDSSEKVANKIIKLI